VVAELQKNKLMMKKTPLYDRYLSLGAKIIDFGGWAMPVQYTNVIDEHHATRNKAGLFDICHMGEIEIKGPQAFDLLQWVLSRNLEKQKVGQMMLSVLTNEHGGIIDDLTAYRLATERYMVVTNAATKDKDLAWIMKQKVERNFRHVEINDMSDRIGKIDIQGPVAQNILQSMVSDGLALLPYYHAVEASVCGMPAIVSRSGYTGEDGFEIYTDACAVGKIWDDILKRGAAWGLKPCGLGARDTLRLEAGMMLYGHELDETIIPLEVPYGWVTNLEKDFVGAEFLRKQKEHGVTKSLVGFEMLGRGIARADYTDFKERQEIGNVTSGTYAPTLDRAVGLAFVPASCKEPGTQIHIHIRERYVKARVVKLPFYKRSR
jgi:aminomethyltransferase